ncbi:MAG: GIY-YIG nuclease family protein, partial [Bacteroidales bacterium]|nr:GIY-YIG nuclease family protein [Bacteroidales bacterium]
YNVMKRNLDRKYDYDFCIEEAKKYTTLQDFRKNSKEAARAAQYRGWINDYTWLENTIMPQGYWNEETCREEALKHDTFMSFHDRGKGAYKIAAKNGWVEDYTWLKREVAKRGFYTKEVCEQEARKYTDFMKFRTESRKYYEQAKKNGWLEEYTWLIRKTKPMGYWTEETCREEAKRYTTRLDFRNKNYAVYQKAHDNEWLGSYYWLEDKSYVNLDEVCDNVYAYVFEDFKSVYIGRTKSLRQRHYHHTKYDSPKRNDTVREYIREHNVLNPEMSVLERNVTIREGLEKEKYWEDWYRDRGYEILNKAATGIVSGSVGGLGCGKSRWTKELCFEEAKKYKTRTEFSKKKHSAYKQAKINGWIDDYTWMEKPTPPFTFESSLEIAKKYDDMISFRRDNLTCYNACKRNGWLESFPWLKKYEPKYTYKTLYELAQQYTSAADLKSEHYDAWQAIKRLQMAKDLTWLDPSRNRFTYKDCFSLAKEYSSLEDFKQFNKAYYKAASWHGWVIDYEWMKDCPKVESNYNECVIEASSYDCATKFLRSNPNLYWYCVKNKWIGSMKETIWKKNK